MNRPRENKGVCIGGGRSPGQKDPGSERKGGEEKQIFQSHGVESVGALR